MRIAEFALDGDQAWPDLRALAISDGLTVVTGPAGSGKSTIAQFIGHVLYGKQPHATGPRSPEGELLVDDRHGRFRLRRYQDRGPYGRLTISSVDGSDVDQHTVQRLLSGTSPAILSQLYAVDFQSPRELHGLLADDFALGFGSAHDTKLDRQRSQPIGSQLTALLARRDRLAEELEARFANQCRSSDERDGRLADLNHQRLACDERVAKLKQKLQSTETALADIEARLRYGQVEAIVEEQQAKSQPRELETRLADADAQIECWRRTLGDLERREAELRSRLAQLHPDDVAAGLPLADQRTHLGVVRRLATDLEGELSRLAHAPQSRRCVCQDAHVRLRPIVESLNAQLTLLDQAVIDHERSVEYRDLEGEAIHLARTQDELRRQLDHLLDRREALLRSARPTRRRAARSDAAESHGTAEAERLDSQQRQLAAERAALRRELATETQQRDALLARCEELAGRATDPLDDRAIDTIRQELAELQVKIEQDFRGSGATADDRETTAGRPASDYLAQLSSGALVQLELTGLERTPHVVTRAGRHVELASLPDAERALVHLSLVLALANVHAQRGVSLPLVLDEPFVLLDGRQTAAVATVLAEFAAAGRQVLVFTRQPAAVERFAALRCATLDVRQLHCASDADVELAPLTATRIVKTTSTTHHNGSREPRSNGRQPGDSNVDAESATASESSATSLMFELDTKIRHFPALGGDTQSVFAVIGIRTVGELLEADPESVARQLGRDGVTAEIVHLWQTHLALLCFVPGITLDEAQLLTGAQIVDPEELADLHVDEITRRVEKFLSSERGRRFRERGYRLRRDRVLSWSRSARQHRSRWHESRHRRNWRKHRSAVHRGRARGPRQQTDDRGSRVANRDSRAAKRRESGDRRLAPQPRMALTPESAVVDAPAIGPKTAARFEAVGIYTVAELLAADPIDTARQLDARHIKADTIATWQQQARLACEIPQLRSRDAQLLVGCGLERAEQIGVLSPDVLLAMVTPYCESKAGERVLRGADQPDLVEVEQWIRWAQQPRELAAV